jgi:arginase
VSQHPPDDGRTYHVLGVPLRTGSLYPGNENDAQAYRDAGLVARLQAAGCRVVDDMDISIPSYLPHHAIPPIRSWPGPRIVWDCISERLAPVLEQPGHVPLLIGCDCSVVIGTTQALMRASAATDLHVLYLDGDFDDAAPDPNRCQSAAALAVWLLTHRSAFWAGPPLEASRITVIGWGNQSQSKQGGMRSMSCSDVRRFGSREAARHILDAIPPSATLVLHFDIDVLKDEELPAAYFPHADGVTLGEAAELLRVLATDPRIRIIEVTEYAALRDVDGRHVSQLIDLLAGALAPVALGP